MLLYCNFLGNSSLNLLFNKLEPRLVRENSMITSLDPQQLMKARKLFPFSKDQAELVLFDFLHQNAKEIYLVMLMKPRHHHDHLHRHTLIPFKWGFG